MATQPSESVSRSRPRRKPHIVALDSDSGVLDYLRRLLSGRFTVTILTRPEDLTISLRESPAPDLVLLDWLLGDDNTGQTALNLLTKTLRARPSLPVVVLTCSADHNDIVLATRMGAADVLLKPFGERDVDQLIRRFLADPDSSPVYVDETPLDENASFVRCSKRMREIESQCALVARTEIPVLILGESGTGKEIAAMFIHKMSSRSHHGFLKVNCAAMPLDLLESELFGYEQGAFTGAIKAKPGKFEICNHGTIFLDEIGEMPATLQAKLLQVLQDGSFSRLGGRTSIKVDVRVIAATNINIKAAIAQKHFREDLYYRLNGFGFCIPPLRERRDEIPILAKYFMRKSSARYGREPLTISASMMQALVNHSWPGNLRELENTIKRYLVLEDERAITNELTPMQNADAISFSADDPGSKCGLKRLVRGVKGNAESAVIAQTLEDNGWNRKAAASELQISYKALLYKIKQYNIAQQRTA
jgi:two-component system, NtrC family, response regulator AtoC